MSIINYHNDFVQTCVSWIDSFGNEEEEKLADKIREDSRDKMGERGCHYGLTALSLAESWFDSLDVSKFMEEDYPEGTRLSLLWTEEKGYYWTPINKDGQSVNHYGKVFELPEDSKIIAVQS